MTKINESSKQNEQQDNSTAPQVFEKTEQKTQSKPEEEPKKPKRGKVKIPGGINLAGLKPGGGLPPSLLS